MAGTLGTIMGQVRLDVRPAVAGYATLRAQNQRTVYALRGTGDAMVKTGKTMIAGGAVIAYGLFKAVNAAAEFERKMDFAAAVSGTTGKELDRLSKFALKLGQDTIYSAGQVADGFIELAKSGISAQKIIGGVGKAMTSLGAAADIPLTQAGQIIVSTISQFEKKATDATHVVNILAGAANASIADVSDIGVALKYVGGVAHAAGLQFDDTATAIAVLANAGIRGSTAGTSLRQMIVSFGGATQPARDALQEIGILTKDGSNAFYDMRGNLKPLSQVFQILQDHLSKYNNQQKLAYLRTIFNNRALSAASILTKKGAKGFKAMYNEMSKVKAADVAHQRLDNLSGDVEILRGNVETLLIQTGGPLQKTLRSWVQGLTRLVQAYGKLSPQTQEMIVKTLAAAAAALIAMGAFNLIVGTILKFIAHMLKLVAGLKFLWNIVKIVGTNLKWLGVILGDVLVGAAEAAAAAIGVTVGVFAAIVVAVLAVIVGIVVLYKKWAPFRKLVNDTAAALWKGVKAVAAFFKALVTNPGKAWSMLKKGMSQLGTWIGQLGGLIWKGLSAALGFIGKFALKALEWFASLPGKALGVLLKFVAQLASIFTLRNIGFAIGYFIGTAIRLFLTLPPKVLSIILSFIGKLLSLFASLAPKIGYAIGFLIGKVVGLWLRFNLKIAQLVSSLILKVVNFFRQLPAKVGAFVVRMTQRGIQAFQRFKAAAPRIAAAIVRGVINFFRNLPANAAALFQRMVSRGIELFQRLKSKVVEIAKAITRGFKDGIKNLPSIMGSILSNVIQAIKDKITEAFNAVQSFASGMWNGFKKGLGINSPSYIEKKMWEITGVIHDETKKISKKTMDVQRLSKKMGALSRGISNGASASSTQRLVSLASMQSRNDQRAGTLLASAGKRTASTRATRSSGNRPGKHEFTITNWRDGEGHFRNIAQDTIDDNEYYYDSLEGMG